MGVSFVLLILNILVCYAHSVHVYTCRVHGMVNKALYVVCTMCCIYFLSVIFTIHIGMHSALHFTCMYIIQCYFHTALHNNYNM